jgi:hypothetical protein
MDDNIITLREKLLEALRVYCDRTGRKPSGAGILFTNDSKFFTGILGGADCTTRKHDEAMAWLAENTPPPPPPQEKKERKGKRSAA